MLDTKNDSPQKKVKIAPMTVDELAVIIANSFNDLNTRFYAFEKYVYKKFDEIDERFKNFETRIKKIEMRLDKIEIRLDRIESKLTYFNQRVTVLER